MTVFYDDDLHAIVENHPDYAEYDDDGRLVLSIEEMPHRKLTNLKKAVEDAIDAEENA